MAAATGPPLPAQRSAAWPSMATSPVRSRRPISRRPWPTSMPACRPAAWLALTGAAEATADVEGTPRANRYSARLDAHATRFATGIAALDGLYGGRLDFAGGLRLDADGGIAFDNLQVNGAQAQARING